MREINEVAMGKGVGKEEAIWCVHYWMWNNPALLFPRWQMELELEGKDDTLSRQPLLLGVQMHAIFWELSTCQNGFWSFRRAYPSEHEEGLGDKTDKDRESTITQPENWVTRLSLYRSRTGLWKIRAGSKSWMLSAQTEVFTFVAINPLRTIFHSFSR